MRTTEMVRRSRSQRRESLRDKIDRLERQEILSALERTGWNKSASGSIESRHQLPQPALQDQALQSPRLLKLFIKACLLLRNSNCYL